MEEIHVQPKKKAFPWILLIIVLIVIAGIIWYVISIDNTDNPEMETTTALIPSETTSNQMDANNSDGWDDINFAAPVIVYDEITKDEVSVRGNENYGIYAVGEDVFFDTEEANLRTGAENILEEIVASIEKHYNDGPIRIYGYTDARGSAGYNMELAQARVEAVRDWLVNHGIDASRITMNAIGEVQPSPANTTAEERQSNRRVEIVARINNEESPAK